MLQGEIRKFKITEINNEGEGIKVLEMNASLSLFPMRFLKKMSHAVLFRQKELRCRKGP